MSLPKRRHPIHTGTREKFNRPIIIFLTVCTKNRKHIFASDASHSVLVRAWNTHRNWQVGRYVLMPDHVHLFCSPGTIPPESIETWIRMWKSEAARNWPNSIDSPIWQRHYWDRQLRHGESYAAKWQYVRQNPIRAGLETEEDNWPYQGELNVLAW